jgi:hypothetical protein
MGSNFYRKIYDSATMLIEQQEAIQYLANECLSCSTQKVSLKLLRAPHSVKCFLGLNLKLLAVSILLFLKEHSPQLSAQSFSMEVSDKASI